MHSHQALTAATLAAQTNLDRRFGGSNPSGPAAFFGREISTPAGGRGSWKLVSRQHPCPICGKPDWCKRRTDGGLALCRRSSGEHAGGWRAVKPAKRDGWIYAPPQDGLQDVVLERVRVAPAKAGEKLTTQQCLEILESGRGIGLAAQLQVLAEQLAVGLEVLEQLGIGWRWGDVARGKQLHDGDWITPARSGAGDVVGVHRRLARPFVRNGRLVSKLYVQGSCPGLFFAPDAWHQGSGPILLPEGMSDTAAMMHCGLAAVGRPSNRSGAEDLAQLLAGLPAERPIIVVGERDLKPDGKWPGLEGAKITAQQLADLLQRPIMWALVPEPAKDAREQLTDARAAGATAEDAGATLAAHLLTTGTTVIPTPQDPVLDSRRPAGDERSMDDVREQLQANIMQLADPANVTMRAPDADHSEGRPQLRPGVHLCGAPTGAGKSHAGLQLVCKLEQQGLRTAFLSQTHEQSAERMREAQAMGLTDCAADPELNEQTCGLWGAARRVRACGLSIQQVLCPTCPMRGLCEFQRRKQEARDAAVRFACHAQGSHDLERVTTGRDALIIDEDAVGALVRRLEVRPKQLVDVLRCLGRAAKDRATLVDADCERLLDAFWHATRVLLRAVRTSTTMGAQRVDLSGLVQQPHCGCGAITTKGHTCDFCGGEVPEEIRWASKLWRLLGHKGQKMPPRDAVALLLDVITGRMPELWVTHDAQATGAWSRSLVGIQRHRLPRKLVLCLDATADRATLEQVISVSGTRWLSRQERSVNVITPDGRPPDLHQARRMVPAGGDVLVGSTAERAAEALRGLLATVPSDLKRLGLICHGGHMEALCGIDAEGGGILEPDEMQRLAKVAGHHTKSVRGSNSWMAGADRQGLDGLLVVGCPNVPPAQVRLRLLTTGHWEAACRPDGGWSRHRVVGTAPDGSQVVNRTMGCTDPAWQEARRQLVHAALLQDAGRARHTLPEGCPVWVLTTEPMPGMLTEPEAVLGIDAQTHALVQEVARLSDAPDEPAEGAESGLTGTTGARIKSLKERMSLGEMTLASHHAVATNRLMARLMDLGWSEATAKRALARAALAGLLSQPQRGRWMLPGRQDPPQAPAAPPPADQPAAPPETQQQALEAVSVDLPPVHAPALVIAAGPPEHPPASTHEIVRATMPERPPEPACDLEQQAVTTPTSGPISTDLSQKSVKSSPALDTPGCDKGHRRTSSGSDPAAVAWLAGCTADEFQQWDERVAILEHGGMPKRQAEVVALMQLWVQRAGPPDPQPAEQAPPPQRPPAESPQTSHPAPGFSAEKVPRCVA